MPRGKRGPSGPLGRLVAVRNVVGLIREMSFDEVRDQAEARPRLLVLGPEVGQAERVTRTLVGWDRHQVVTSRAFAGSLGDLNAFDAVVVYDPEGLGRADDLRDHADRSGVLTPILRFGGAQPDDEAAAGDLRGRLIGRLPDRAVALGRACPPFRALATKATIDDAAKANAQFALVSNIPAIIPLVGGLVAASADTLVLTKNQLMLFFKVAAIHGRELRDMPGIIRELLPVVGGGVLWRTLAREAASFVPLAAGTIPKVAIAYAGTVSAGRAADYYYRFGHKPTRDQLREFYRRAALEAGGASLPTGEAPGGALPGMAASTRAKDDADGQRDDSSRDAE